MPSVDGGPVMTFNLRGGGRKGRKGQLMTKGERWLGVLRQTPVVVTLVFPTQVSLLLQPIILPIYYDSTIFD